MARKNISETAVDGWTIIVNAALSMSLMAQRLLLWGETQILKCYSNSEKSDSEWQRFQGYLNQVISLIFSFL